MILLKHNSKATAASILLAALLSLPAFAGGGNGEEPLGATLLKPFKQQLMAALKAGRAEGPAHAIDACRVQAPEIAASLSTAGVRLGRTSHRLRNPANAGPGWAQEVMADYLEAEEWPAPRTISLQGGREGYAEPIRVQGLCLACHGESVAPDVASVIAEHYPQDRATGFSEGDLRGIFWVEYATD